MKKSTSDHIIDHAAPIFAEKGFGYATGKAITASAGVNAAAINYHFGSMTGLYSAVLARVTDRLLDLDDIEAAIAAEPDPYQKLVHLITPIVTFLTEPTERSWAERIAGHELIAPTGHSKTFANASARLVKLVTSVVTSASGLDYTDTRIPLLSATLLGALQWLVIADRTLLAQMYAGMTFKVECRQELVETIARFALGGVRNFDA